MHKVANKTVLKRKHTRTYLSQHYILNHTDMKQGINQEGTRLKNHASKKQRAHACTSTSTKQGQTTIQLIAGAKCRASLRHHPIGSMQTFPPRRKPSAYRLHHPSTASVYRLELLLGCAFVGSYTLPRAQAGGLQTMLFLHTTCCSRELLHLCISQAHPPKQRQRICLDMFKRDERTAQMIKTLYTNLKLAAKDW